MKSLKFFILLFLVGCIGVDLVDDRVEPEVRFTNSNDLVVVKVGSMDTIEFMFVNHVGVIAAPDTVRWSSSDTAIFSVNTINDQGVVFGKNAGRAELSLYVATADGQQVMRNIEIRVDASGQIIIDTAQTSTINLGSSQPFEYMYVDDSGNEVVPDRIDLNSSDTSVVAIKVNEEDQYFLEPRGVGMATISLDVYIKELQVLSTDFEINVPPVEPSVKILSSLINLKIDSTYQFAYTYSNHLGKMVQPDGVQWSSSDMAILTIDNMGLARGIAEGEAMVILDVSTLDGQSVSDTVTLGVSPDEILTESSVKITSVSPITSLDVGTTYDFNLCFLNNLGEQVEPDNISWTSSNTGVLTIDQNGMVTGVGIGTATIMLAATLDGQTVKDSIELAVRGIASRVEILSPITSLDVGATHDFNLMFFNKLGQQVEPDNILWMSSDTGVLTIDPQSGVATGIAVGSANITLTVSASGGQEAMASLDVQVMAVSNGNVRTGSIITASYGLGGGFSLYEEGDELVLAFDENYTFSGAPGPYLYLTNNENSRAGGHPLGKVTKMRGAHEYRIPKSSGVTLTTYDVVFYYCDPASIRLGYGRFDN